MSDSDPAISVTLQQLGNDLVTSIVCIIVESVLFTFYTVLVIKTTSIWINVRKESSSRRIGPLITLAVVLLMYILCCTLWIIDLVNTVAEVRITMVKDPDVALDVKYAQAGDFTARRLAAIDAIYAYLTCLGDGVIIWRLHAFWASSSPNIRYMVLLLPLILLLGSIACSLMLTYCVGRLGGDIVLGSFAHPEFCRNIQAASYALPAATTAVTTLFIAAKFWTFINFSGSNGIFSSRLSRKSRSWTVLVVLIETGVAYFLFFLAQAIGIAPSINDAIFARPDLAFAMLVFSYQTSVIVGMYPTIIICLVHAKRSAMDAVVISTTVTAPQSRTLGSERVPISLSNLRGTDGTRSTSTGDDLESQPETLNLRVLRAGSNDDEKPPKSF
ncbi:hypothetical protein L218DRAFT_1081709 [Marasmius fiardii PR-910]|nr:hypothetical protein L218DRAFT_1081709 [Marasmius fiardii PR-910]